MIKNYSKNYISAREITDNTVHESISLVKGEKKRNSQLFTKLKK